MKTPEDDDRPKCEVTREEFRLCAVLAGWQTEVIDRFLRRDCKVRKFTGVGTEQLRVTDW